MSQEIKTNRQSGQTIIMAAIFFTVVSLLMVFSVSSPAIRQLKSNSESHISKQSLFLARSAGEDIAYRLQKGLPIPPTVTITIDGQSAVASSTAVSGGLQINSIGNDNNLIRILKMKLRTGTGASFSYGVQAGEGGITMANSSSIEGNVYSNGEIIGDGNIIEGSIVSAGPSGKIFDIHSKKSAYAHSIENSAIDGDAYYQHIKSTEVKGISHPGSPDQTISSMPIPDSQIEEWKTQASEGGVIASPCPYKTANNETIGPKKIDCDLEIKGDKITLMGPIWVVGNITITGSAKIKVSPSLGNVSVAIIADNPNLRDTEGVIHLKESGEFFGNGGDHSFVLLVSKNSAAQSGDDKIAINLDNSAKGDLLVYAPHGKISLSQSVQLKEVTGYKITTANSSSVIYESGLANLLFTGGPAGGYSLDWLKEMQ